MNTRMKQVLAFFVCLFCLTVCPAVLAQAVYFPEDSGEGVLTGQIGVSVEDRDGKQLSWGGASSQGTGTKFGEVLLEDGYWNNGRLVYDLGLTVGNPGGLDIYTRAFIYAYFCDSNGSRLDQISPEMIHVNCSESGWVVDALGTTLMRKVLYYEQILQMEDRSLVLDSIEIDALAYRPYLKQTKTAQTDGHSVVCFDRCYDVQPCISLAVDAVQTHSAKDTIASAWGRQVSIDENGKLTLL